MGFGLGEGKWNNIAQFQACWGGQNGWLGSCRPRSSKHLWLRSGSGEVVQDVGADGTRLSLNETQAIVQPQSWQAARFSRRAQGVRGFWLDQRKESRAPGMDRGRWRFCLILVWPGYLSMMRVGDCSAAEVSSHDVTRTGRNVSNRRRASAIGLGPVSQCMACKENRVCCRAQ